MAKIPDLKNIASELKLATSKTKKLVEAGLKGDENFPKLFAEYKWPGTRDYNMALIIIALFAYCMRSKEISKAYKRPIKDLAIRNSNIDYLIKGLKEGNGKMIHDGLGSGYASAGILIEEILTLAKTDCQKWPKIKEQFFNQVDKIKSWKINKSKAKSVGKQFKKQLYADSATAYCTEFAHYIAGGLSESGKGLDHYLEEFLKKNNYKTLWKKINRKDNLLTLAFSQRNPEIVARKLLSSNLDCREPLKNSVAPNKSDVIFDIFIQLLSDNKNFDVESFKKSVNYSDAISYLTKDQKKDLLLLVRHDKVVSFCVFLGIPPQVNLWNSFQTFNNNLSACIDISKKIYDKLDDNATSISESDFTDIQNSINTITNKTSTLKTFIYDLRTLHEFLNKKNSYADPPERSGSIIKLQGFETNVKNLLSRLKTPRTTNVKEVLNNLITYLNEVGDTAFKKRSDISKRLLAFS